MKYRKTPLYSNFSEVRIWWVQILVEWRGREDVGGGRETVGMVRGIISGIDSKYAFYIMMSNGDKEEIENLRKDFIE